MMILPPAASIASAFAATTQSSSRHQLLLAVTAAASPLLPRNPAVITSILYITITNAIYLARRASIRKLHKRDIWAYRTTRTPGMSLPLFIISLLAWQFFVICLYPIIEPLATLCFGYVSFMYDYPNAHGVGYILEPITAQSLCMSKRTKTQIRFDWHEFEINVGKVGREGYRHPPCITYNLPHVDIPRWGVKHWPWRRRRQSRMQLQCDDIQLIYLKYYSTPTLHPLIYQPYPKHADLLLCNQQASLPHP